MYHVIANGKSTGRIKLREFKYTAPYGHGVRNPLRAVTKGSGIRKNAALLFDEFLNLAA